MFLFGGSNLVVHISLPTWVSDNFEDEGFTPKHKVGNVIIIIEKYLRESVIFVVLGYVLSQLGVLGNRNATLPVAIA